MTQSKRFIKIKSVVSIPGKGILTGDKINLNGKKQYQAEQISEEKVALETELSNLVAAEAIINHAINTRAPGQEEISWGENYSEQYGFIGKTGNAMLGLIREGIEKAANYLKTVKITLNPDINQTIDNEKVAPKNIKEWFSGKKDALDAVLERQSKKWEKRGKIVLNEALKATSRYGNISEKKEISTDVHSFGKTKKSASVVTFQGTQNLRNLLNQAAIAAQNGVQKLDKNLQISAKKVEGR